MFKHILRIFVAVPLVALLYLAPAAHGQINGNGGVTYQPSGGAQYCTLTWGSLRAAAEWNPSSSPFLTLHGWAAEGVPNGPPSASGLPSCWNNVRQGGVPDGTVAISYTLWKWNSTTNRAEVCDPGRLGWFYNSSSLPTTLDNPWEINIYTGFAGSYNGNPSIMGCGPGWYNLGLHAYHWENGWQGGTFFVGWLNIPIAQPTAPH